MSILFLTCGPTHSGKTTFGARLRASLGQPAHFIHVDNDVVDEFIKENYNNLRTDPAVLAKRTPQDPDLRLLIPQLVTGYALGEGYGVIATAAHPKRVIRQSYYDIAKSKCARVVLLIFRVSEAQALQRIQTGDRHTGILDISPHGGATFQELFRRQQSLLEEPSAAEKRSCFKVFEVTEDNANDVLEAAKKLAEQALLFP